MKYHNYWRILLAYRAMILLLCLSALISSVLLTYLLPEKYEATAVVLVRPEEKIKITPNQAAKEVLDFPLSQLAPIDAASKTYMEVIKSNAVVERLVRTLDLDKERRTPSTNVYEEVLQQVKGQLKDYIDWAGQIMKYGRVTGDAFTKATETVQKNLTLKATKDTYIFEITYLSRYPDEAAAVANMAADIFLEHMANLNRNESAGTRLFLESRLAESERELAEARRALREFKETYSTISLKEEYSKKLEIISDLESDFEKTETKLAGLVKTYTSSHPKVVSLLAEKNRLAQALSQRKLELSAIPEKEKQLESLKLRVKVSEDNYELINKDYQEARIQEAGRTSEIRIVSPAIPPSYPAKPIKYYYALGGLSMALIIGVGLALFLESRNARVRSVDDVNEVLQLPVLATIPTMSVYTKAEETPPRQPDLTYP